MIEILRRIGGARILTNDGKGPWGGGDGPGSNGNGGNGGGPRNPWAFPPSGKRPRGSSLIDEIGRRMRGGGGGGGFPGGAPEMRGLWLLGLGILVAAWIVLTSFHSIQSNERGVVTMLGRYSGTLGPGLGTTLPYPFASVAVVSMTSVRTEEFPENGADNLVLTQDQNLINLSYSVNWYVNNAEDFSFQIADPRGTVKAVAESVMRAVIATVPLNAAIGSGQDEIAARARDNMQTILDRYHSGIQIQTVAIRTASAPPQVDEAFKAVSAAEQGAQGMLSKARAYAQQRVNQAQAEAAQFDKIYAQYKLAPEVTKRRLYYETMEQVLGKANKTIVEAPNVVPYLPLPPGAARAAPDAAKGGAQ